MLILKPLQVCGGYDGNKKFVSIGIFEFDNEGKVETVDESGNTQEVPIFLNREISNGLVRASEGRVELPMKWLNP